MNDKALGAVVLVGSLAGVAIYFYLVFLSTWSLLAIQVSAFLAVAAILFIVAWIGYTQATTPPPTPMEDFEFKEESDVEESIEEKEEEPKKT